MKERRVSAVGADVDDKNLDFIYLSREHDPPSRTIDRVAVLDIVAVSVLSLECVKQ